MNVVVLHGSLSRDPEERTLPSGDRLLAYEVTVREDGRPTESVPVTWLDPPAKAGGLEKGTEVVVTGRVRRRFFRAGGATASRTEVVAVAVVPASQRKRASTAVAAAVASLSSDT
jgi:single-strand DNA-binding protein